METEGPYEVLERDLKNFITNNPTVAADASADAKIVHDLIFRSQQAVTQLIIEWQEEQTDGDEARKEWTGRITELGKENQALEREIRQLKAQLNSANQATQAAETALVSRGRGGV